METQSRQANRTIGISAARRVRSEIGYDHPNELEIEVLAYMRGVTVRRASAHGARANLLRVGDRAILAVADGLSIPERRWAIAHELGHFEAHADVSFIGLCSSEDMLPSYRASGREPEANAFAEELLMPEDLVVAATSCAMLPEANVPAALASGLSRLSWHPIEQLASSFSVSLAAAAIRFLSFQKNERIAIVCMNDGMVVWASATKAFGPRPRKNARVKAYSAAHDFFTNGAVDLGPRLVPASAWIDGLDPDHDVCLVEQLLLGPKPTLAMSLLTWKSENE